MSSRVLLLYPEIPDTFWSLKHALRFFGRKAWSPPLGLLTVAALLPPSFEQRLCDLSVQPLREEDLAWADYVFISAMEIQRQSALQLIERCKMAGVKVVAGGPLFTNDPESFTHVDHLILNEAELTLPEFLADFAQGKPKPRYSAAGFADLHASPVPAYALIDMGCYAAMSVQFSRGCPNQCDFCNVTALFGYRPRIKTAAQIIAELDQIYALGWRGKYYFVDDNLACNKQYLKNELLPAIIQWKKGKQGVSFHTQITMNLADDPELADLMYEAGFDWVFIGIETPDENCLKACHKQQNLNRNLPEQIARLQRSGLQVQGGFIVGFDQDTPDIFRRQFEFIQANGIVMAMVGILQAPVGTKLYQKLQQEGRLLEGMAGVDFDRPNFVTRLDGDLLRREYQALVKALYHPRNYYARVRTFLSRYKEPKEKPPLNRDALLALLRCFFWLGLIRRGRTHFWKSVSWALVSKRESLQTLLMLAVLGYHFRKVYQA